MGMRGIHRGAEKTWRIENFKKRGGGGKKQEFPRQVSVARISPSGFVEETISEVQASVATKTRTKKSIERIGTWLTPRLNES